ncbi:MAG TPA: tRNA dihydrouridine synthase DusB [Vicinamibacterales bacterium]|nr:tRNA dihydrouridine synthase DusB [Vicinamibacterales bacterium]
MKIGPIELASPFVVSPMAGMTDTAFRRLVKRQGGCGLVVSEMVSSEGLVRGIDRTLEYAEYTEEERPVSIQIFGGEPAKMAEAARVVESMGANIVDVNMGCPVPKIAKHHAGCSLMREPAHAAEIIAAMSKAVKIPVTVKMRKGWDEGEMNAGDLARRVEDAGAKAIAIHGRTAKQSYSGVADWDFVSEIAKTVSIPVFGSGDCIEPEDIVQRMKSGVSGVYVGRGVLRNPWILAQARDLMEGRPARVISDEERGQFLLDYMELLLTESLNEDEGFRHKANGPMGHRANSPAVGRERWVINKIRALCSWYTKGFEGGAQFRIGVNSTKSIPELQELIERFFLLARSPIGPLA